MSAARLATEKADFRPALPMSLLPGVNGTHMTKMTYTEQLAHPKWQKRRLGMLNAANWSCSQCGCDDVTLHVHHKQYVKGRMAWEYEDSDLAVLCKKCHECQHEAQDALKRILRLTFAENVLVEDFAFGFFAGMLAPFGSMESRDIELALEIEPRFFAMGYMVCALGPSDIADAVRRKIAEGRIPGERGLLDFLLEQESNVPQQQEEQQRK